MPRVTHFDIVADDPDRVKAFWREAFGWKMDKWSGEMDYWMISTGEGDGIDGGMSRRLPDSPTYPSMTIDVDDIEGYMDKVKKAGGQQVAPKIAIPGVGWFMVFQDTEGNVFGMMESDSNAR